MFDPVEKLMNDLRAAVDVCRREKYNHAERENRVTKLLFEVKALLDAGKAGDAREKLKGFVQS